MGGMVGCDLDQDSKYNDLEFDNASRFTVSVIPLTAEWSGFSLAPGEKKKFGNIDNPDFSWEPIDKVAVGVSSSTRDVVFVDKGKDPNPPTIIVVTNEVSSR